LNNKRQLVEQVKVALYFKNAQCDARRAVQQPWHVWQRWWCRRKKHPALLQDLDMSVQLDDDVVKKRLPPAQRKHGIAGLWGVRRLAALLPPVITGWLPEEAC
jgi:hypothetical protein